ncbi:hypothetical protein [Bifidobacterium sp. ESL0820]|uniref:hypothetical protein n=1 Tax=Bifidobacterium sp. ESL0820 TaxID=3448586 RepID=UPI00404122C7
MIAEVLFLIRSVFAPWADSPRVGLYGSGRKELRGLTGASAHVVVITGMVTIAQLLAAEEVRGGIRLDMLGGFSELETDIWVVHLQNNCGFVQSASSPLQ